MQNKFPLWKNLLLIATLLLGVVYAVPNLYSEDPAIQVSPSETDVTINLATQRQITATLADAKIPYKQLEQDNDQILIRFNNTDDQLHASDLISATLGDDYTVALNLAPSTPDWLSAIGAEPMKLGLDLRGGVHFLVEVDLNSVISRRLESIQRDLSQQLREERIRYVRIAQGDDSNIIITFRNATDSANAADLIASDFQDMTLTRNGDLPANTIQAKLLPAELSQIHDFTIQQTMTILRNRVNELGVADAVVQQQGNNRVSIDLPGIQDSARAKQILGGTATLEFHLVDIDNDPNTARTSGIAPVDSQLYEYQGGPILLNRQVILSGESITNANSYYDQEAAGPAVNIKLGGGGDSLFARTTRANVGRGMAIVYVETKDRSRIVDGQVQHSSEKVESVISVATIQSALGSSFRITGIGNADEARDLALLLRAGALPAAIYPVEERTIGPSLGQENIKRGLVSLEVGLLLVLIAMILYYRLFGCLAVMALLLNIVFLVAILSLIGATLTLPGIAGIVLTVGMAVDANVLIYERIREELRNGVPPQSAIHAGYQRALGTIVDANITTLIVALILFAIGSGPIKGFAVTLSIGLLISMLTAITYTRALVNIIYGRRTVKRLSIGIKQGRVVLDEKFKA